MFQGGGIDFLGRLGACGDKSGVSLAGGERRGRGRKC